MPRVSRKTLSGSTALATGVFAAVLVTPAFADDHAVSAPTLSVESSGGSVGGSPSGFFAATGTVPVGDRFGFQLDGQVGQSGDRGQGGTGAHFFWRDPDSGLVGATALWSRIGGWNIYRYGVETEAYFGDFTVAPSAGLQRGAANKGNSTSGYATLDLSWYTTEDLKLSVGGSGYSNIRVGFAAVEWQPMADTPFTLFANGGGGNRGPGFALAGIRYAFGADGSSLKNRNRHGDPENLVSFTNAGGGGGGSLATQAQAITTTATKTTSSGGCFIAGTEVLMADGSVKTIESVEVGDLVRGADGAANRVEVLHRPVLGGNALYALNGGTGFVTDDHPFMTPAGWKAINPVAAEKTNPGLVVGALVDGDVLVTDSGEVRVQSIESVTGAPDTPLFNFSVSGNHTFFVRPAGVEAFLLVHNKGCFISGTAVLMADSSVKAIEDVAVGDMVRGADGATNRVETLHRPVLGGNALYAINGGAGFVTDDHPFMTPAGWKAINPVAAEKTNPGLVVGALTVGDVLVTDGGEVRVQSVESATGATDTPLFNFSVSGNRTFLVRPAGMDAFLLVHNK